MKQILIRRGVAVAEDVPAPMLERGTVLVRVRRSCVSAGTELSGLQRSGAPLWKLAARYPEHARKAVKTVGTIGLARTWSLVQGQLSAGIPVGYSAAGIVLQAGEGLEDFRQGDRVACAGAQCAHHAEVICVPRNLMTRIPDGVGFAAASTVTLGAIALQGVRRANPTLGETFVVIGLGAIGQLTVQILRANGCTAVGVDLDETRLAMARELGMTSRVHADDGSDVDQVLRITDGVGADGVIITAATPSHAVVSTAFRMCRRKGRVVLVGDVGLHLSRADFYQKEIDFFISCAYGPGRYDRAYEEGGVDYPVGYVRWTENRNMQEYLRLVAAQHVQVEKMITATYPVEDAAAAYETLAGDHKPLLVLLSYPDQAAADPLTRLVRNPKPLAARPGAVRIALVGAGGFAKSTHLPNLRSLGSLCHLQAVISRSGDNAVATARRWGAAYAGTEFRQVLDDPHVDAVIIATRHNLHAGMALAALRAGKHVLLEKPLALTTSELDDIEQFFAAAGSSGTPILLTGFNRRFSAHARQAHEWVARRNNPMLLSYRMNAGYLALDHWTQSSEGGGRNLGEACHIYDLFTYLTGARIERVDAAPIRPATSYYKGQDNFTTSLSFDDGSVASLIYTALGSPDYSKERLEIFVDGKVIALDDYKSLTVAGGKRRAVRTRLPEKGQKEELAAFAQAIRDGGESPIPLWEQVQATRIALEVEDALSGAVPGASTCAAS